MEQHWPPTFSSALARCIFRSHFSIGISIKRRKPLNKPIGSEMNRNLAKQTLKTKLELKKTKHDLISWCIVNWTRRLSVCKHYLFVNYMQWETSAMVSTVLYCKCLIGWFLYYVQFIAWNDVEVTHIVASTDVHIFVWLPLKSKSLWQICVERFMCSC